AAMKAELVDQHAGGLEGEDDEEEAHARHGGGLRRVDGDRRPARTRERGAPSGGREGGPRSVTGATGRAWAGAAGGGGGAGAAPGGGNRGTWWRSRGAPEGW